MRVPGDGRVGMVAVGMGPPSCMHSHFLLVHKRPQRGSKPHGPRMVEARAASGVLEQIGLGAPLYQP
jgi:hypothetical protein